MIPRALAGRPWVRRHPFATGILAISGILFGLMLALPGDEDRGILLVGISAFALPIVAVVWLVTWLIDRRKASRAGAAMADASLAPSEIWPPAASPVTPRDVASLFKIPPAATTPVSSGFGSPSETSAPPSTTAPTDVASLWRTQPSPTSPPAADPPMKPTAEVATTADSTADVPPYQHLTLDALVEMTPAEFERRCIDVLLAFGFSDLVRTVGAGDLGTSVGRDPFGRSVVVQTIRYTGDTLGTDTVQSFVAGTTAGPPADRAILMATSDFSQPASQFALEHDVLLIDGDALVALLNLTGSR